jgi:hypothetical protein
LHASSSTGSLVAPYRYDPVLDRPTHPMPLPSDPSPTTPAAANPPSGNGVGYVRGGGVELDARRAGRVVAGFCIVVLAGIVIGFTVAGFRTVQRNDRLTNHGVAVIVTVTHCVAQASGTGATVTGYQCQGSFTQGGHRYDETIGGTTTPHSVGQRINAVTDPSDPHVMATAASVAATPAAWQAFVLPAVTLVVLLLLIAALRLRARRRARSSALQGELPAPGVTS